MGINLEYEKKTIVCILQAANWEDCTGNDLNMTKKRKSQRRNRIFFNSSTYLCHKDQLYKSEN